MTVVVDASVAMAWCFEDEQTEATDAVLAQVASNGGVVPALWALEVTNVLLVAERRSRLTRAQSERLLTLLDRLPLELSEDPAIPELAAAGRQYGLTAYDTAYLLCALREGLPLATLDADLAAAARAAGVTLSLS